MYYRKKDYLLGISQFAFAIEILLITWACSGTHSVPMFAMLTFAFLSFATAIISKRGNLALKSPFLYFSIFLFFLSILQSLNPYEEIITTSDIHSNLYKLNYIEFLPSSVKAPFSKGNPFSAVVPIITCGMLSSAAFVILRNRNVLKFMMLFFTINVSAMGAFAIYQKLENIPIMYNTFYSTASYYGTFFLSNAAATFLGMGASVCLYLASSFRLYRLKALMLALFTICVISMFVSGSDGGKIEVFAIIIFYALFSLWKFASVSVRSTIIVSLLTLTCFSAGILTNLNEIKNQFNSPKLKSLHERIEILNLSLPILKENLIFGVGGDCFRYHANKAIYKKELISSPKRYSSLHHTHCDILQYAIEYGIIGLITLTLTIIILVRQYYSRLQKFNSYSLIILFGILLCFLHSFFDLHLHITSTLLSFILLIHFFYFASEGNDEN